MEQPSVCIGHDRYRARRATFYAQISGFCGLLFHLAANLKAFRVEDMQESEKKLLNALLDLEDAVRTMATANPKPDLQAKFARIDALTSELPKSADPQLLHYLHKKSYEKARMFMQG